jgi:hypothetical protein
MCEHTKVHVVTTAAAGDLDLLLSIVRNEMLAELLDVRVDVKMKLADDREPDVVGA